MNIVQVSQPEVWTPSLWTPSPVTAQRRGRLPRRHNRYVSGGGGGSFLADVLAQIQDGTPNAMYYAGDAVDAGGGFLDNWPPSAGDLVTGSDILTPGGANPPILTAANVLLNNLPSVDGERVNDRLCKSILPASAILRTIGTYLILLFVPDAGVTNQFIVDSAQVSNRESLSQYNQFRMFADYPLYISTFDRDATQGAFATIRFGGSGTMRLRKADTTLYSEPAVTGAVATRGFTLFNAGAAIGYGSGAQITLMGMVTGMSVADSLRIETLLGWVP